MCANLQTYNKTQEGSQNVTRNTTYGHFDQSLAETANSQFFTPLTLLMIVIPSANNPSISSNLVIFGPWDIHWHMESCFQRFGWVFKATRGVKTELVPKKSYFCWNHKVKSAISSTAIKHPKTPKFLNFLAIFQNDLVKRMGKALVPAVPRLFSHLGHPSNAL